MSNKKKLYLIQYTMNLLQHNDRLTFELKEYDIRRKTKNNYFINPPAHFSDNNGGVHHLQVGSQTLEFWGGHQMYRAHTLAFEPDIEESKKKVLENLKKSITETRNNAQKGLDDIAKYES